MIAAYIALTAVAATVYAFAAYLNFVHHESVIEIAEKTRVPQSWIPRRPRWWASTQQLPL